VAALEHVDSDGNAGGPEEGAGDGARRSREVQGAHAGRQKQFLYFMNDAKKAETRLKRIAYLLKQLS
jgi:hypothetical protein